jgi:hypothetical protein
VDKEFVLESEEKEDNVNLDTMEIRRLLAVRSKTLAWIQTLSQNALMVRALEERPRPTYQGEHDLQDTPGHLNNLLQVIRETIQALGKTEVDTIAAPIAMANGIIYASQEQFNVWKKWLAKEKNAIWKMTSTNARTWRTCIRFALQFKLSQSFLSNLHCSMQHYIFTPMDMNTTTFPSKDEAHHFYTAMLSRPDELENGLHDPPTDRSSNMLEKFP